MQEFSTPLGNPSRVASRLLIVMVLAVLLGSAVARADVVLDWNEIAVNTAIANGKTRSPRRATRRSCNSPYLKR